MKKTFGLTLILVCIVIIGAYCNLPVKAQSRFDITINSDGSVSPSYAPIQQTSNTYLLTSGISGSITVEASNIVLDGNGYSIAGWLALASFNPTINLPSSANVSSVSNVVIEGLMVTGSGHVNLGLFGSYVCTYYMDFSIITIDASSITLFNNTVKDTQRPYDSVAISLMGGGSNVVRGNNIIDNTGGVSFANSNNNLVFGNNIIGNAGPTAMCGSYGISFFGSSNNNIIYANNFIDNKNSAWSNDYYALTCHNTWDNGTEGNFWSDYNGTDANKAVIGDTPYTVNNQNVDRYPLMHPISNAVATEYLMETRSPDIEVLSPTNQTYNQTSVPIVFLIDKPVNLISYILDGQQNVIVNGNFTIANMTNGFHNVTVYANDTFGNIGASQPLNFSVAVFPMAKQESFLAVTVGVVFGAITVLVVVGLLTYFRKRKSQALN